MSPVAVAAKASSARKSGGEAWTSLTALTAARGELAASLGVIGSEVFVPGGTDGTTRSTLYRADLSVRPIVWSTRQSILSSAVDAPRHGHAVVTIGTKLYVIGGINATGGTAQLTLLEYDADPGSGTYNTWTNKANMPAARYFLSAVAVGTKIYVVGGTNGTTAQTNTWVWDQATNTWSTLAVIPAARQSMPLVDYNGRLYAAGGYDGSADVATLLEYDIAGNAWSAVGTKTAMPFARRGSGVALMGTRMVVIGGRTGSYFDTVAVTDLSVTPNAWGTLKVLPEARSAVGGAQLNGRLYAIAGYNSSSVAQTTVYEWTP